jgi:O-glycosyl hydrolase/uncharacterized protein YjdB
MDKFIAKKQKGLKFRMLLCAITMASIVPKTVGQTVTPWMTTGDQSKLLQQQANVSFGGGTANASITINTATGYQTMDGFGYTLTEGSCELISGMSSAQQNALLNDFYGPSGISTNVVRISIGASDLSSSSYSYNETAGDTNMANFSLAGPDATYLIPILKKILAINPAIKILATPWSAPRWMKSNNSWIGGSLQTQYYAAYARYFVKYFDAMKAQGINIWGITPQNEPENGGNEPSLVMTSTEQKNFINQQLGPQMAAAGYGNIKIIAFDHNCDNPNYAIDVANNSTYVEGSAFHKYAGDISAMTTVHNATNKSVYFTEQYTGPGSFSGDFAWHMLNVVIGSANNWSKAVLEWNVASNPSLGPRTPGGCSTCLGAVTINGNSYSRNVAYYIIGQVSKFVKPGALRVATSSSNSLVIAAGFKNPDGSVVLIAHNQGTTAATIKIASGSSAFDYTIPAASAVTFNWATGPAVAVTGVSVNPTSATVAVNGSTQLTATISPANATNTNVNWVSSNTAVASVNANGLVIGNGAGTATITATTQDGGKTASAGITVSVIGVAGVSVSPSSAAIFAGQTQQLSAAVLPANASNKSVTWSSSNTNVANVNSSGLVTAIAQGTAIITATTVSGGFTATCNLTVKGQEAYNGTPAILPGVVQAENYDTGGQNVAYNDADPANQGGAYRTSEGVDISGISGTSGFTTGWAADGEWLEYTTNVTAGTYTVYATVASPNSGKQLRVKLDGVTLGTLNIPNTADWNIFQTVSIANIPFAGGNGKILRLEIVGGEFNIDKIEVKSVTSIAVTGVTMTPTAVTIAAGATSQLTATVAPSNASNKSLVWSSSNNGIASVNNAGLVSGVAAGTATITVTTVDGNRIATSNITVSSVTNNTSFPGYYNIISKNSNKGLDVADNSTASGGRIQQYDVTNNGGDNQRWKFEAAGGGNYYIKVKSTQMCLAAENTNLDNGVKIVQKTQANAPQYKWTITSVGGGYYKVINVNSGKALDVEGVSTSNGASIHLWDYVSGANQQWRFDQVEATTKMVQAINEPALFPNPVQDTFNVVMDNSKVSKVEIMSKTAEVLLRKSFNGTAKNTDNSLDVSNLPNGIYIVRITAEGRTFYKKMIKQ